jgi:L-ascorbate metabolism protein UlaG (beta-lactamase superfamily)
MSGISRRMLLGAAGCSLLGGGLEAASLGGAFDHRERLAPSASERARESLARRGDGVVHIAHSTHLIEVEGVRVLTDPWFGDPAFGALAHSDGPACGVEELAGVDVIAISHEHPDHADLSALDRFPSKGRVLVLVATEPLRSALRARGFVAVERLASWGRVQLDGVSIEAVPALHDVPELGFVVSGAGARVYFAGDTAFQPEFSAIRERCRPTFALLPVDGTRLRGSALGTLDARDAVRAAGVLGVTQVMPSHAEARFTDPLARHVLTVTSAQRGAEPFARELARSLPNVRCLTPRPGDRVAV